LQHDPDLAPQVVKADVTDVHVIDSDGALLGSIEAADQGHSRRLTGSRRPDEPYHLARLHVDADVLEHWLVRVIAEGDPIEDNVPLDIGHRNGRVRLIDLGSRVQNLEDTLAGREASRDPLVEPPNPAEGRQDLAQVHGESHELTQGDAVLEDLDAAGVPHQQGAGAKDEADGRHHDPEVTLDRDARVEQLIVAVGETADLAPLLREGLHNTDSRQRVIDDGAQPRPARPHPPEVWHQAPEEPARDGHHQGPGNEADERELPVHGQQNPRDDHEGADHPERLGQSVGEQVVQRLRVLGYPSHQRADVLLVEVLEAQPLECLVQFLPDVSRQDLREPRGDPGHDQAVHQSQDGEAEEDDQKGHEELRVSPCP